MPSPRWLEWWLPEEIPDAPRNPKAHDEPLLDASLDRFGYTEPVLIDERTQRLVAGHGRKDTVLRAEAEGGDPPDGILVDPESGRWRIPVVRGWASQSDEEAEAYLVASNATGPAGGWVLPELADVLAGLAAGEHGLTGVGYTIPDLDLMLAGLAQTGAPTNPLDEWDGMPEYEQGEKDAAAHCAVHFPTLADRDEFFRLLGRTPTRSLWWPQGDGHVGSDVSVAVVADEAPTSP